MDVDIEENRNVEILNQDGFIKRISGGGKEFSRVGYIGTLKEKERKKNSLTNYPMIIFGERYITKKR